MDQKGNAPEHLQCGCHVTSIPQVRQPAIGGGGGDIHRRTKVVTIILVMVVVVVMFVSIFRHGRVWWPRHQGRNFIRKSMMMMMIVLHRTTTMEWTTHGCRIPIGPILLLLMVISFHFDGAS